WDFYVSVGSATIGFGLPSAPLAINQTVDVPVHLAEYDDWMTPVPNSTISIEGLSDDSGYDSGAFTVSPSSVTTDQYGNGIVHLTAKKAGTFTLKAKDSAGDAGIGALGTTS